MKTRQKSRLVGAVVLGLSLALAGCGFGSAIPGTAEATPTKDRGETPVEDCGAPVEALRGFVAAKGTDPEKEAVGHVLKLRGASKSPVKGFCFALGTNVEVVTDLTPDVDGLRLAQGVAESMHDWLAADSGDEGRTLFRILSAKGTALKVGLFEPVEGRPVPVGRIDEEEEPPVAV